MGFAEITTNKFVRPSPDPLEYDCLSPAVQNSEEWHCPSLLKINVENEGSSSRRKCSFIAGRLIPSEEFTSSGMCIEKEREALLRFKKGFNDERGVLASWGGEENTKQCCRWEGVRCSNTTHNVIALRVNGDGFSLQGSFTDALLDLHYLTMLDLSGCDFGGNKIPNFIASLDKLQHLNLMGCSLSGNIPSQLGNLSKLNTLDLSYNADLEVDNLDWLYHLPLLSRLYLSSTNVSDTNWLHAISSLPSLKELDLSSCHLPQLTLSSMHFSINSSFPSLTLLDLSYNRLTSLIFTWLANTSSSLVSLQLRSSQLDGRIPETFGNMILLDHLDLSNNTLGDGIPKSVANLSNLNYLDLSDNQIDGYLPNLSGLFSLRELHLSGNKLNGSLAHAHIGQLSQLEILDVSSNMFDGNIFESDLSSLHNLEVLDLSFNSLALNLIPTDWIPPFQLRELNLGYCKMGPQCPRWIQTQNDLTRLDLSGGGISSPMPEWLSKLSSKLEYLNLSHNQFSGTFPDLPSTFVGFSRIDISFNKFSGFLPIFRPNTTVLNLSRNMFRGPILSICTYDKLGLLDLSNNHLSGEFPYCWTNMSSLSILDLSNNTISGQIPNILGSSGYGFGMRVLVLHDNNLSGELPKSLESQSDLRIFDVGGNQLTGTIPSWIGTALTSLRVLGLRDNRFYGTIPLELCHLTKIQILDISGNNISGRIHKCFSNFTSLAQHDRLPEKLIPRNVVEDFGDGSAYRTWAYIENAFVNWKRKDTEYRKTIMLLKLIDLSDNELVGSIPKEISLLRGLVSLNLSRNHLTGSIDSDIGQLEMLECLDLSRNHLSGEIPVGLGQLTFLSVFDLSNNNLSGSIPSGTQLRGFDTSTYAGNNGLCGPPLAPCHVLADADPHISLLEEGKHNYLDIGFYIFAACGFILGFWGAVIAFFFTSWWRNALSNFWNKIWDWLYVRIVI